MSQDYAALQKLLREVATLASVGNLLHWDQETMMPPKAAPLRAEELALVARLAHERATNPRIDELLTRCEADSALVADPLEAANLREIRRDYDRALKLPPELVAEINETSSHAVEAWKQARADNDFGRFRPWLERQFELGRRKAECFGAPAGGELYDALVDEYEQGMTGAELERILDPLRDELVPLIESSTGGVSHGGRSLDSVFVPESLQHEFNRVILSRIGFDDNAGRIDVSVHPFSSGIGPGDTRITTRYREDLFLDTVSSTLHEAGHALYEQGLPKQERWGQALGEPLGLGIHESQSRLWENHVGRSHGFWTWALPEARRVFGPVLDPFTVDDLYFAANQVRPNLIRIESDEATYNLHIMLRFDLERALLRGDLATNDLPGAWNERIRRDLGLEVPDDRRGCLQDIHWSMGSIGYFPTYTLGNLYGAQFWEAIVADLPELDAEIRQGRFDSLLGWLREKIHRRSRSLHADELCRELTGRPLDHAALMRHLRGKFEAIYAPANGSNVSVD